MGSVTVRNIKDVGWNRINRNKNFVYIGRGSVYGNPFSIGRDGTREEVIEKYRSRLQISFHDNSSLWLAVEALTYRVYEGEELNLVCYCAPKACHGDVIKIAIENIASRLETEIEVSNRARQLSF